MSQFEEDLDPFREFDLEEFDEICKAQIRAFNEPVQPQEPQQFAELDDLLRLEDPLPVSQQVSDLDMAREVAEDKAILKPIMDHLRGKDANPDTPQQGPTPDEPQDPIQRSESQQPPISEASQPPAGQVAPHESTDAPVIQGPSAGEISPQASLDSLLLDEDSDQRSPFYSIPRVTPSLAGPQGSRWWSYVDQQRPASDISQPSSSRQMSRQSSYLGEPQLQPRLSTASRTPQQSANVGVSLEHPYQQLMAQQPQGPSMTQRSNNQYIPRQHTNMGMSQVYPNASMYQQPAPVAPAPRMKPPPQQPLIPAGVYIQGTQPAQPAQPSQWPYGQPPPRPMTAPQPTPNPVLGGAVLAPSSHGSYYHPAAAHTGGVYLNPPAPATGGAVRNHNPYQQYQQYQPYQPYQLEQRQYLRAGPATGTGDKPYEPQTLEELYTFGWAPCDNVQANVIHHEKMFARLKKKDNKSKENWAQKVGRR